MFKKVMSITLSIIFIVSLFAFTSCSIDFRNEIEKTMDKILKANSFTVTVDTDEGKHIYMVNNGTIYFFEDYDENEETSYLYSQDGNYYYAHLVEGEETTIDKFQLEKGAYAAEYMEMLQESEVINQIFAYRHILDMAEKTSTGYKYTEQESTEEYTYRIIYTIEMDKKDLVLTHKYESKKERQETVVVISDIGKTKIEIPNEVLSK